MSVTCLDVLCAVCGHVPAGCVLLSPCGVSTSCFPGSVSAWAVGQAEPFFGMFIVNIIMLYSLQYRYYQVCELIVLSYFIYYTVYQIDNLRVIDSYLLDWIYISPVLNYFH